MYNCKIDNELKYTQFLKDLSNFQTRYSSKLPHVGPTFILTGSGINSLYAFSIDCFTINATRSRSTAFTYKNTYIIIYIID